MCTVLVKETASLCAHCWKQLNFIQSPWCHICGMPFDFEVEENTLCGRCCQTQPLYRHNRSALRYDDGCKGMILRFKHTDATHLTVLFSKWMNRVGRELLTAADYVVPVPLHWQRLLKRRYNQAALLTLEVAKNMPCVAIVDLLIRTRSTPSQGYLKTKARQKNVAGAFVLNKKWCSQIIGKKIVLVDDVLTSGATVHHCVDVLLKAGALYVDVLTLARVVQT